jgi:hypothetical protein
MRGVSANIMCGQEGYFGTNSFDLILDLDKLKSAPVRPKARKYAEPPEAAELDVRNDVGNLLQASAEDVDYSIDI